MRPWGNRPAEPPQASPAPAPGACPACGSTSIVTTTKVPDDDSYWRCTACGEVWNNGRRQAPGGFQRRRW